MRGRPSMPCEDLSKRGCCFELFGRRPQSTSGRVALSPRRFHADPQSTLSGIANHRQIVPLDPLEVVSQALPAKTADTLEPLWLCVEGFARSGIAGAHSLAPNLLADKPTEWDEQVWCLKVQRAGALS